MFQAYKMKMIKTPTRVRSYIYKNCSVCFSREEEGLVVSIAPHYDMSVPDKEELNGILSWFGIDPDKPYETYQVRHWDDPAFGSTHYFVQPA